MVNKARISLPLILGLVILSTVLYCIYNTSEFLLSSSVTFDEQRDQHGNITNYRPKLLIELLSAIKVPTEILGNTMNNSIRSVETISPEPVHVAQVEQVIDSGIEKSLLNGVATRKLYHTGHDISNKDLCPDLGASLQFLVLITSAPINAVARMAIRQTWGHYAQRKDIGIGFVLGQAKTRELTSRIRSESDLSGDIIVCRFMDSYDNLTLKTISMMEWIDNYCPKVKFILKTDDDMFINVPKLISFVKSRRKYRRKFFGRLAEKWPPYRDPLSKWFISTQHYVPGIFPDFTTGPAYLLTGDIVHDLYIQALNTTYLKLEDVFMTGVVAQAINVKRINARAFLNLKVAHSVCNVKKYISIHEFKYHEQFDLWKKLLDGREKCRCVRQMTY